MAKKDKTYHFRDKSKLLDEIPEGKKSEFIREALHLRINIDDAAYQQEQVSINELKAFLTKQMNNYENQLKILKDDIESVKSKKRKVQNDLRKVLGQEKEINNLINTKKQLIKTYDINQVRMTTAESIIRNVMYRREDPSLELLNIDYLREECDFKTKDELKIYVQEYITDKFRPNMLYLKWMLKQEDIQYMKVNVNKIIK